MGGGGDPPDEANVHAKTAVAPAALEAHEDSIRNGRPLRVLGVAVDAALRLMMLRRCWHCMRGRVPRRAKNQMPYDYLVLRFGLQLAQDLERLIGCHGLRISRLPVPPLSPGQ